jgi:hypothetical protein
MSKRFAWLALLTGCLALAGIVGAEELARWGFDEGRGTTSADLSAYNGRTITMLEGALGAYPRPKPLWGPAGDTPSGKGHALALNGSSDYASPELDTLGDNQWTFSPQTTITNFSISVWMKSQATNDLWRALVGHMDAGGYWAGHGWALVNDERGGDFRPTFRYVVDQGTNRHQLDAVGMASRTARLQDVWTHVALTYQADGGPTNAIIRWYINGRAVATNRMPRGVFLDDTYHQLNLGVSGAVEGRNRRGFFCGLLDEVRLFDEILTPEQVALLHRQPEVDGRALEALAHPQPLQMSPANRKRFLNALRKRQGYRSVEEFRAAGNGREDDTLAFQAAINWQRGSQGEKKPAVVFVPPGKYRITGTLVVWDNTDLVGDPADPPTLFLPLKTVGFDKPAVPKPLIVFASGCDQMPGVLDWSVRADAPRRAFRGQARNLRVRLEKGNPGAIGILVRDGQTNVLQDVTVTHAE